MNEAILDLRGIHKHFLSKRGEKTGVLQGISLRVDRGSITGIIGKSGAGKSTLLRCMNLLERPDQGQVFFEGTDLTTCSAETLRQKRHSLGMVFQHFNLPARRTVLENVLLPTEIAKGNLKEARMAAIKILEDLGLGKKLDHYPAQLSGGQKQRLAIARVLAGNAKVLLCDEITSALDPETTEDILHLLRDLRECYALTIILITHEISVIRSICDHVAVIDAGNIVERGTAESIFANPTHATTQSLLKPFLKRSIPEFIRGRLLSEPAEGKPHKAVFKLTFSGYSASEPLVSQFIREAHTDVNILSGFMDQIGSTTFGTLVIDLPNKSAVIDKTRTFLTRHEASIEPLGYISHD